MESSKDDQKSFDTAVNRNDDLDKGTEKFSEYKISDALTSFGSEQAAKSTGKGDQISEVATRGEGDQARQTTVSTGEEDRFNLGYKLETSFTISYPDISDIRVLNDGMIVILRYMWCALVTCDMKGEQLRQMQVPDGGRPFRLDVVDDSTVAVVLTSDKLMLVDVRRFEVIRYIETECENVAYQGGELFVQNGGTIFVMDIYGNAKGTITPYDFYPRYYCVGENGHFYCTVRGRNDLICMDKKGITLYTVAPPLMAVPYGVTTDNEGFTLVIAGRSHNVHRISSDGKTFHMIINLQAGFEFPKICFHSASKSVIIAEKDKVFIYKKT